jgi:O-antigen ligase
MINLKQMSPEGMFGSFPYRANAAQYLNLIWPLALGFWWALRSDALRPTSKPTRTGSQAYPMLLLCVALMVAAVFVAASRGGIAVTLVEMALAMIVLGRAMKGWQPRLGMALAFLTALGLGWGLAGDFLAKRFTNSLVDESMSGRTQIFEIARRMTADFPLWGSGAESFLTLNGLYRVRALDKWHGYVHDDWLETRVTFGWVGLLVVVLMLASAASAKWVSGRVPIHRELAWLLAIGLAGMLGHAFGDFPFQMPALHVSFLVGAAVFSVVGAPMKTKAIPGSQPREQR